jgi:hypothetical protein
VVGADWLSAGSEPFVHARRAFGEDRGSSRGQVPGQSWHGVAEFTSRISFSTWWTRVDEWQHTHTYSPDY